MTINLQKGQTINLEKSQNDLSSVTIGLGWDVRKPEPKGFLGKLFSGTKAPDYDLDAIAFLLDDAGKIRTLGQRLIGGDVIFYNNPKHPTEPIWSTGDNRTGGGDGDDEQIVVKLTGMSQHVARIVFLVAIYQGRQHQQHFGMVENAFIRAVDGKGKEMARYDLTHEPTFTGKCSMLFGELYRHGSDWKFRALGEPRDTDTFVDILKDYLR